MKGITPIIAIILLLLITIAIVGFAFVFFNRISTSAAQSAEEQAREAANKAAQQIGVENAAGTSVALRATGTQAVATASITVYINDSAVTCTSWSPATIPAGGTATCTLPGGANAGCSGPGGNKITRLRVVGPGNSDPVLC